MKKTVSILAAAMMTAVSLASTAVSAGNSTSIYAAEDLGTLASSLGADTDHLNIPFMWDISVAPDGKTNYSDESYYITIMDVLIHNGELKISDLQADAAKMSDISDNAALREKIRNESQRLVNNFIYHYAFKNDSAKDKIPALLATAEKAYANNEYFHIGYRGIDPELKSDLPSEGTGHHVTGIGITDGSWTFNGRVFDKCILTLDTVNTANGESAFSEDTCIYVNSETYDYYIPKYSDSATEDIHIIAFDNDTMVNGDTSALFNIRCTQKNSSAIYTITSLKDGIETVRNRENEYLDYCHNAYNGNFFIKADSFKINCDNYGYSGSCTMITNDDTYIETQLSAGNSTFTFDGKAYHITGTYYPERVSPVGAENNDSFFYKKSNTTFDFYGRVSEGFYFEPANDSFFIDGGTGVRFVGNEKEMGNIFASQKTEVRYDENGITDFFIDIDKDGQFEHKVEKGDVNCDGTIDASDASLVLQAYSSLSTGGKTYLNSNLADWDENGAVDASDASFILQKYAELSTT